MSLSAWIEGLTPQMVRKAQVELGETPEVRKQAVQELTKLLRGLQLGPCERFAISRFDCIPDSKELSERLWKPCRRQG
ncbi:hypothetical protein AVEN_134715-1 [Araneus ventricosus]|uniref:Uncharacterized protein n=2 Tax=Araneus ventricosus TaxID=182803 RepID=A0A4Y2VWW6_ARAVE|nr:hypothetical protein AVEN_134715-1 [Araneus ventricosus]